MTKKIKTAFEAARETLEKENQGIGKGGSGVTSFGFITKGGFVKTHIGMACLASLRYGTEKHAKAFFIWQEAPDNEVSRAWISFVLGPKSPWRDVVKRQPKQDVDYVMKNGYVLTDLQIPGNFFVNFLMGFRLPKEKYAVARIWFQLQRDGVDPAVAAFLVDNVGMGATKDWIPFYRGSWHYAFAPAYSGLPSIDRVRKGKPYAKKLLKTTFFESTQYQPNNSIWGGCDEDIDKRYIDANFYDRIQTFTVEKRDGVKKEEPKRARKFKSPIEVVPKRNVPNGCSYEVFLEFCKLCDKKEINLAL